MPTLISAPTVIESAGNKPKVIQEFVGRVNSRTAAVSVARMVSPGGWAEPAQTPEFDEYTVVLRGTLRVTSQDGSAMDVRAGQAVIAHAGERVTYSTPAEGGAEYVAVCLPAFSPATVHREGEPAAVVEPAPDAVDESDFCADCGAGIWYHGSSSTEIDGRAYCGACAKKRQGTR